MPVDKTDPAFKKAVAEALAEMDAAKKKKATPPKDYAELEDRLADRVADRVLEKLAGGGDDPEDPERSWFEKLFFGTKSEPAQ